ncbi:uncharacterized protein LOC135492195 [Lineus longissimus]|uniref:uncharacterized protein LOC135492195 n=1 Tax=Lineus longissimus TaxID=88925 RepID=UPI002B4D9BF3
MSYVKVNTSSMDLTNSSSLGMLANSSVPSSSMPLPEATKTWSDGVDIGVPVVMIILFVLIQLIVVFVKTRKSHLPLHVPVRLHVSAKSDFEEKSDQQEKKVTISPDKDEIFGEDPAKDGSDERTIETAGDVDRMRQHAKEQAKKSRKSRQLSLKSITSMVSRTSSQFEYSELEEQNGDEDGGMDNQLVVEVDDDSDAEVDTTGTESEQIADGAPCQDSSVITVTVEHHSPPKHLLVDVEAGACNRSTQDCPSVNSQL